MPIYEYRCSSCGVQKDILQKISDETLTVCPVCSQPTFTKQISAAGFQLKGSGWYVTDFKSSGSKPASKTESQSESKPSVPAESATSVAASPAPPPASEGA